MAVIDIIILIIFAVAVIDGYRKGFIGQIGSMAAIVVAVIACRLFGPTVSDVILPSGDEAANSAWSRYTANILGYCLVYIIGYYAVILASRLLKMVAKTFLLGPIDAIGGALVSVLKWFMAVSIAANLYIVLFPSGNLLSSSEMAGGKPMEWIIHIAPAAIGALSGQTFAVPPSNS